MKFRSPLSRARGLGSAGHGSGHWSMQRFTAIALVPLALWFLFSLGSMGSVGYEAILAWLSLPWVPALLVLFFACAYFHASLGIQVVIEDYFADEFWRNALIIVSKLILLLMAASTIVSILITAL